MSGTGVNFSFCSVNPSQILSKSHVPAGAIQIIGVHFHVSFDEDSGFIGFWAIDNHSHSVRVWQVSPGNFYATSQYNGTWTTFKSALSPEVGDFEFWTAHGPFAGGLNFTFTGTFHPTLNTTGKIGPFNFGGSVADVLKGKYASQTGPTTVFDWVSAYFTGVTFGTVFFGFGYNWFPGNQIWCNFDAADGGSIGDIVT